MKLKLNLQHSYDKVKFFTLLQFLLVIFAFFMEAIFTHSVLNFTFLFEFIILIVTFNFYYNALLNLYYSYWNISFLLGVYYLVAMSRNFLVLNHPVVGALYLLSLVFLTIASYIIASPLYFPRVNWWEYDFRFRADIRCWVDIYGVLYRARLSDLRRGAACLELFQQLSVGQMVQINLEILNQNFTLSAEIRSKREPILGRSVVYGIKFQNIDLEQKQRLKFLTNFWNESKKIKIRNKFASTTNS